MSVCPFVRLNVHSETQCNHKPNSCVCYGRWNIHDDITGARECSPVLTVIHHSNGRFCDFLLFLRETTGGQTPQPIVTQDGLIDADSGKDVAFGVKIETFLYHLTPSPRKPPKFGQFWSVLRKFSLDFASALAVSLVNALKSSSEPPKSIIVNRQCWDGKSNYGIKFFIGVPVKIVT